MVNGSLHKKGCTYTSLSEVAEIEECWKSLYRRYSKILGQKEGDELTALIYSAAKDLDDKFEDY